MTVADHRLILWRLIDARIPAEIAQLEALAGTTQRAPVDYAIERSGLRDCFPGFSPHSPDEAAILSALVALLS